MGRDIHVKILMKDEDSNTYREIAPYAYDFEKCEFIDVSWRMSYCDRNYELFEVLNSSDRLFYNRGVVADCPEVIKNFFKDLYDITYIDWCELVMFAQTPGAMAIDDTADFDYDEKPVEEWPRKNVVQHWVDRLRVVLDMYEVYCPRPGDIIIQIGFDC